MVEASGRIRHSMQPGQWKWRRCPLRWTGLVTAALVLADLVSKMPRSLAVTQRFPAVWAPAAGMDAAPSDWGSGHAVRI